MAQEGFMIDQFSVSMHKLNKMVSKIASEA
jgi:hypothetical protein